MITQITGTMLESCISDSLNHLQPAGTVRVTDVLVYSFPQQWPSSACGFAGAVAMQAFWIAPTIVIEGPGGDIVVYHKGKFAGYLKQSTPAFEVLFGSRQIPGQSNREFWIKNNEQSE